MPQKVVAPGLAFETWDTTKSNNRNPGKAIYPTKLGAPSFRVLCEWVGYHDTQPSMP